MSRRDGAIVAWHEVPGTAPPQKSRPVGYGVIRATRNTSGISCARSYRTLRDGSFEGRFPRHFVPGYDRCCPYGTGLPTCARLRSVLSLRDTLADMCQATIGVVPTGHACRHVPGYDRCCPYGTGLQTCARLRSVLSLRDRLAGMCQATIGFCPYGTRLQTCARLRSVLSLRDTLADMCQAMIGVVPTGQACRHFTTASN